MRLIDLEGMKFGRLTVVGRAIDMSAKRKEARWKCVCDCGHEIVVSGYGLRSGHTKSCGCYQLEKALATSIKHGETKGGISTDEYKIWAGAKRRCTDKTYKGYKNYGGRGIKMCNEWRDNFSKFIEEVGRRPGNEYSIDRIDNDGDYEPGNVRWATRSQQNKNRRRFARKHA